MLLGAGLAQGLGAGLQWATAAGAGTLEQDARVRNSDLVLPYSMGMIFGGTGQMEGLTLSLVGGKELARGREKNARLSRPLRISGGVMLGLGGAAAAGTGLMWPTIRERCSIGVGCGLAGVQAGAAVMSLGGGMLSYGAQIRPYSDRRPSLPKKVGTPLIAGTVLIANGYVSSAIVGTRVWQGDPDNARVRRVRNGMLIPIVGPWIVAAGPDAPLPFALVASGLGALQIGGTIALAIGAGRAAHDRRKRDRQVAVVPNGTGVSVVGRF